MKIRLEEIPPEGLEVSFTDSRVEPQNLGPQVGQVLEPPAAQLTVKLLGEVVRVQGQYQARLGLVCSRCLRHMPQEVAGELDVSYRPQDFLPGEEVQLGDGELEVGFYQDGEVDLAQAVRDELSLSLPMAPLCAGDCPGLCPVCGRALSEGPCDCRRKELDPRWAKLAKLDLK